MENQLISDEQYFTFMLAGGKYAIEVTKVREILEYESITKVPKALPYMKGVMNNRGSVITVIDLRILFGFEVSNDLSDTEIVITEISENRDQAMTVGVIADSVDVVTKLELVHSDSVSFGATPACTILLTSAKWASTSPVEFLHASFALLTMVIKLRHCV